VGNGFNGFTTFFVLGDLASNILDGLVDGWLCSLIEGVAWAVAAGL
jgi:hypothetical protein